MLLDLLRPQVVAVGALPVRPGVVAGATAVVVKPGAVSDQVRALPLAEVVPPDGIETNGGENDAGDDQAGALGPPRAAQRVRRDPHRPQGHRRVAEPQTPTNCGSAPR